jgi:hypothetical protein
MQDKRRLTTYHWPEMYVEDSNKGSVRSIANGIIAVGQADTVQFGGFSSEHIASAARPQLWALAQALYALVPRATAMDNRSMPIPDVFLTVAQPIWIQSNDAPHHHKKYGYLEDLERHARTVRGFRASCESMQEDCDSELLVGHVARFKMGKTVFQGVITRHESGSKYWVEFESRRHKSRLVDLELLETVGNGEYSWWRLDGYDTLDEREEDGEEDEPEESRDDERDMQED